MSVNTTATLVIPALLAASGSLNTSATSGSGLAVGKLVDLQDGVNEIIGLLTAVASTSINFIVVEVRQGAVGNTLASGARVQLGYTPTGAILKDTDIDWSTFGANKFLAAVTSNGFPFSFQTFSAGSGVVPVADGGTGLSSYAIGDILYASASGVISKLADVSTGNVLRSGGVGAAPAYGQVNLTTDVTGALPATNGGTGHASYAVGDLLYASTTTALSSLADVATGSVLASGGVGVAPAYTNAPAVSGANLTASTIPLASLASVVAAVLTHTGSAAASTVDVIIDSVTAAGTTTTVTLTGGAVRANANFFVLIQDNAATGVLIATSAQATNSFTFTSINTHVYSYILIGT